MAQSALPRCKETWKRGFKLLWREAGPSNHHDDNVDSDLLVVDEELSLCVSQKQSNVWEEPWARRAPRGTRTGSSRTLPPPQQYRSIVSTNDNYYTNAPLLKTITTQMLHLRITTQTPEYLCNTRCSANADNINTFVDSTLGSSSPAWHADRFE